MFKHDILPLSTPLKVAYDPLQPSDPTQNSIFGIGAHTVYQPLKIIKYHIAVY